jgi:kynureninase
MAFNWVISQLDSIPSLDGMDKVISVIHYRAQKQYEEDVVHFTADAYGALSVEAPHEASFTPYDEVTKEMVEGWLTESLDCEAIEANLDAQIQNFLNPPIVAYPLPWNNNSENAI